MGLASKLAEVMAAVERVPKNGHNDFHNYDYATEADIVAVVRKELAERQIVLLPEIRSVEREAIGQKGEVLTTLMMAFTFIDGESKEMEHRLWLGVGSDKGDKGAYKAMTGGEKYFLLKTFLIPTGDDPEATEAHVEEPKMAPLGERPKPQAVKDEKPNGPPPLPPMNIKGLPTRSKPNGGFKLTTPAGIPEPPPLTDDDFL